MQGGAVRSDDRTIRRARVGYHPRMARLSYRSRLVVVASLAGAAVGAPGSAAAPVYDQSVAGFVSAKGERALVMGYPGELEIWTYPLQLASAYRVRFRVAGMVDPIDAAGLLRRVERRPFETVRTYVGPNFVVRERMFVPRREAGAILRYEVEGRPDVQIEVSFRPSLNLMWPGALGGRSVSWDARRSGYVESEPLHGFTATIASREAIAHDDPVNHARPAQERLAMVLAPRPASAGSRDATLVFALGNATPDDPAAAIRDGEAAARADYERHVAAILAESTIVETPDPAVDRALASATLALDAAWSCNDRLGCGTVAGYGPSRPDRRPQYAWFFGGDGLVAMEGMLAAGQYERARAELDFVTRYQDPKTGMIWHEMSQSAALIDWVKNYHYMYVHVDISFQYLAAVRRYVATTGDVGFVRDHRRALRAAWDYCRSVIDPATGLPAIPPGKQGQNEQEELRDDIRLSSLWIDAADGYAALAEQAGDARASGEARVAAARARRAIAEQGWDDAGGFWLSGHRRDGSPVTSRRPDAIGVLSQKVVSDARIARVLDQIASPDFMTDWGVRSLSASDPAYDPNLYSAGSVWALGSATVAETFWREHRPLGGWAIWRGMVAGDTLDSAGHLHEVMAGDLYHPEFESVPEQTWSSAGLILAAMRGMLGLEVEAAARRVTFAPHLPLGWDRLTLRNVRIGADRVTLRVRRDGDGIALDIDNPGAAVAMDFAPMLPAGAQVVAAAIDDRPVAATVAVQGQDRHARLRVPVAGGTTTHVRIGYTGGVEIAPVAAPIAIGAGSRNPIVAQAAVTDRGLDLDAWVSPVANSVFALVTARRIQSVAGATVSPDGPGRYRLTIAAAGAADPTRYVRQRATVTFAP